MLRISMIAFCLSVIAVTTSAKDLPAGMTMVSIPGGSFDMGTPVSGQDPESSFDDDEDPIHTVVISGFELSETEVTLGQYCEFLNGSRPAVSDREKWIKLKGEDLEGLNEDNHIYCSEGEYFVDTGWSDHPVVNVSWFGAKAFCDHYGLRLPTEAEWEYAAGGPNHCEYPWGDEFDENESCNWDNKGDGKPGTMPVKSFPPNGYGLFDMAGNAQEWCADEHDPDYYARSPEVDPCNIGGTLYKVIRGGSWRSGGEWLRCADRWADDTSICIYLNGFRVAAD